MQKEVFIVKIINAIESLRGIFRYSDIGQVLLPFIFLKRIDSILEESKKEVQNFCKKNAGIDHLPELVKEKFNIKYFNISEFDLNIIRDSKNDHYQKFCGYIEGFSSNIKEIYNYLLPNYLTEEIFRSNRYQDILEVITKLDLSLEAINEQEMGDLFEYLITFFAGGPNYKDSSDHYTPREIIKLMIKLTFIDNKEDLKKDSLKKKSFYDGCAGSGGVLTFANKELRDKELNQELDFYGQELNAYSYALCKANLLINGLGIKNIELGDSLCANKIEKHDFDYLVSIPPFGQFWGGQREAIERGPLGEFAPALPRRSDSSFLFLLDQINRMKKAEEGGSRSSILLFGSPLFTGSVKSGENKIREYLIKEDLLEAIIALPEKLFYTTSIPTFIWILSNKKNNHLKNKVCFINARDFVIQQKSYGSKKEIIPSHDIETIQKQYEEILSNGSIDDINFKIIDSNKFIKKEVFITAKNNNFLNSEEKEFKTTLNEANEMNSFKKKHPWLGTEFTSTIDDQNIVEFNIIESFKDIELENKISTIESEYSNYKRINLGQLVVDINFFQKIAVTNKKTKEEVGFTTNENAIYMYFSGSKNEIIFDKTFNINRKFLTCAQILLNKNKVNANYLINYFNSSSGQESLFNLKVAHSGFRVRKIIRDPLIISNLELPLPDTVTQQEILDIKKLPQRLIDSLQKMDYEINLNPTTSPVIRKKLLEMMRITEELTIEDHIKELIRNGENKKIEFKESFSLNMFTLKKDPVIALSSLKTVAAFLNSDGGTLLIGVTDNGYCKGCQFEIEKLHQGIEDKFLLKLKDSIRENIGLEFSEFYKVNVIRLDKNISLIKVDCSRSNKECFIGDDFYVRTNPGTDILKGRKLVEYSKIRFES